MTMAQLREKLLTGVMIPAHPLALTANRKMDERRQRALTRYYLESGAGGIAVGVHTTQFAIRDRRIGLLEPVLSLASETSQSQAASSGFLRIAGVCGNTSQATQEAELARGMNYDAALVSLTAMADQPEDRLIEHCRILATVMPVFGFYLQAAVGGRRLSISFWRKFVEIENVVAIKIAPFNRYQTLDVVRAVVESGRRDVALYTGNDDNITMDLLTPFAFNSSGTPKDMRIVGGLLGHWACWTKASSGVYERIRRHRDTGPIHPDWFKLNVAVTDMNAAIFDAANGFSGCIAGIHEVLRRQGLLEGIWCLDPEEGLSPGQSEEIDRVTTAYPDFVDDTFVAERKDKWLA